MTAIAPISIQRQLDVFAAGAAAEQTTREGLRQDARQLETRVAEYEQLAAGIAKRTRRPKDKALERLNAEIAGHKAFRTENQKLNPAGTIDKLNRELAAAREDDARRPRHEQSLGDCRRVAGRKGLENATRTFRRRWKRSARSRTARNSAQLTASLAERDERLQKEEAEIALRDERIRDLTLRLEAAENAQRQVEQERFQLAGRAAALAQQLQELSDDDRLVPPASRPARRVRAGIAGRATRRFRRREPRGGRLGGGSLVVRRRCRGHEGRLSRARSVRSAKSLRTSCRWKPP